MTKRIISLLLTAAMLLSMTSCSKKEQNLDVENMTLEEYIDKVELPKNLAISIDPSTVEERETVKVYGNADYLDLDDEIAKELLLRNPITKEEQLPNEGTQYIAETDTHREALSVDQGGLNYSWRPLHSVPTNSVLDSVGVYPQMYDLGKEASVFEGIFDSAEKELDFASREEIVKRTEEFFTAMGLSAEVHEIVAYDTAIFQSDYEVQQRLYQKYSLCDPDYPVPVLPQKSDEFYEVFYRPLLDGIPICTYDLRQPEDTFWHSVPCTVRYTIDGIVNTFSYGLIDPASEGTETEILSAAEALELAKAYYGQGVLLKPHTIEEMELVYILYQNEDRTGIASIRPYWLIKTSYMQEYEYPEYTDWEGNPLEGEIKAYDFTYFDAVTGEYFIGSTSAKPYE